MVESTNLVILCISLINMFTSVYSCVQSLLRGSAQNVALSFILVAWSLVSVGYVWLLHTRWGPTRVLAWSYVTVIITHAILLLTYATEGHAYMCALAQGLPLIFALGEVQRAESRKLLFLLIVCPLAVVAFFDVLRINLSTHGQSSSTSLILITFLLAYCDPIFSSEPPPPKKEEVDDDEVVDPFRPPAIVIDSVVSSSDRIYRPDQKKSPDDDSLAFDNTVMKLHRSMAIDECNNTMLWKKGPKLGQGGFGVVHLGLNEASGELMAVKSITIGASLDEHLDKQIARLQAEISYMRDIVHENIVRYYYSESRDSTVLIFMEYVSGGSLHQVLRDFRHVNEALGIGFTRQILHGLSYLHGKNYIHLDVKCANVLLTPQGVVKLSDFGVALNLQEICMGVTTSARGTTLWMAPEVISNGHHSWQADIWSLGCTVMEMLTAKPPFSHISTDPRVVTAFIVGDTPIDLTGLGVSVMASSFLAACLQRDPDARPTIKQLLGHAWLTRDAVIARVESMKREHEKRRTNSTGVLFEEYFGEGGGNPFGMDEYTI